MTMGLLSAAARVVHKYLKALDKNPALGQVRDEIFRDQYRSKYGEIRRVQRLLETGEWKEGMAVNLATPRQVYLHTEGRIMFREERTYPSVDLLKFKDGFPPYDGQGWDDALPEQHWRLLEWASAEREANWDAKFLVALEKEGKWLCIEFPFHRPSWNAPRMEMRMLQSYAKKEGYPVSQFKTEFLEERREPHPDIRQRSWVIPADKTRRVEEYLLYLVLCATKQRNFPITSEEHRQSISCIASVLRKQKRLRWVDDIEELANATYDKLFEFYDFPNSVYSLRGYIRKIAFAIAQEKIKQQATWVPSEPFYDENLGFKVYPVVWISEQLDIHKTTVYRWEKKYDLLDVNDVYCFSETHWHEIQYHHNEKKKLQALTEYLIHKEGKTPAAAKKYIQRKRDRGDSFQDILTHLGLNMET
jgi:hypothetical protein